MSEGISINSLQDVVMTVEARQCQSRSVPSPLVNVTCEVRQSTDFIRNLTFLVAPTYTLGSASDFSQDNEHLLTGIFDLRKIWDEQTLRDPPKTLFEWREFPDADSNTILAAFILMQNDTRGPANVSMCSVYARWASSELYLLPAQSNSAVSNFTFSDYDGEPNPPNYLR